MSYVEKVIIKDSEGKEVAIYDGSLSAVDLAHRKIHEGKVFDTSHEFISLGNNQSAKILIKSNGEEGHMFITGNVSDDCRIELFIDPTFSDDGTEMPKANKNTLSSDTTGVQFFHSPITSNDGTRLLIDSIYGGGVGAGAFGGQLSDFSGWIIGDSTNYLLKFTNTSGGNENVTARIVHYIEDNN